MAFNSYSMSLLQAHAAKFQTQLWFILRKSTTYSGNTRVDTWTSVGSAMACSEGLERRVPYEDEQGDQMASSKLVTSEFPVNTDIRETDLLTYGMSNIRGAWDNTTSYAVGDGVILQGNDAYPALYVALVANTGVNPYANANRSTWQKALLDEVTATDSRRTQIPVLVVTCMQRN